MRFRDREHAAQLLVERLSMHYKDQNPLVLGVPRGAVPMARIEPTPGVGVQKLHGEVDALEIPSCDRQIARIGGATTQDDGIEFVPQAGGGDIHTDGGVGDEGDTFLRQQIHPPLHDRFIELHVRNSVHEQPSDAIGPLVHRD